NAASGVSPCSTLPPGNSQRSGSAMLGLRSAARHRPSRTMAAPTTDMTLGPSGLHILGLGRRLGRDYRWRMLFDEFERAVRDVWEAIPDDWKSGVVALVVDPEAKFDPDFPDTPLLGECMIDPAVAMVPDAPIHSIIHIYFGSFVVV